MHSSPTSQHIPHRRPSPAPHSDTPFPSIFSPPSRALPLPHAAPTHARRLRDTCPPTAQPISRRRPPLAPAQHTPFPSTSAPPRSPDAPPQAARCLPRRPHNPFPVEALRSPPHSDTPLPSTSARPRSPDARPQAARCIPRRPHNPFPAAPRCLPFRSTSGTKKRHRTVHVRCRMFRSTVVAVGHLGW